MPRAIPDIEGYRFYIYHKDHQPPHCHVRKDGATIRVSLDDLEEMGASRMVDPLKKRALALVSENLPILRKVWNERNPG